MNTDPCMVNEVKLDPTYEHARSSLTATVSFDNFWLWFWGDTGGLAPMTTLSNGFVEGLAAAGSMAGGAGGGL
eukprot:CAMPEP_0117831962 /NCGR_PEP_ID=MMETSP0949-20121206/9416_1 /TAXON_ID=44440 /ORGANISM="Chattonella subsalsa, Strain CCMP2191" /LENGTH=72 /DNA_ID=CAMNT_0005673289 /DNA_START=1000 /DNA_END=1218 /DNA_ORIENTATION=-